MTSLEWEGVRIPAAEYCLPGSPPLPHLPAFPTSPLPQSFGAQEQAYCFGWACEGPEVEEGRIYSLGVYSLWPNWSQGLLLILACSLGFRLRAEYVLEGKRPKDTRLS